MLGPHLNSLDLGWISQKSGGFRRLMDVRSPCGERTTKLSSKPPLLLDLNDDEERNEAFLSVCERIEIDGRVFDGREKARLCGK
jgi:hypothetical protein